jgi:lysozyme
MDISQRGLALIKDYEGYSAEAYLCSEGVPTIGWGSTRWDAKRPVKLGDECTVDQAETLLRKELQRVEDAIDAAVKVPVSQGQFDAICSLGFNIGTGWISGVGHPQATFIRYLNKGEYEKVPSEFLKFRRGANTGNAIDGLLNRRKREVAELWLADYQPHSEVASTPVPVVATVPTEAPMPQAVTEVKPSPVEAVQNSASAKSALVGLASTAYLTISNGYSWLFDVAKEAGPQVIALRTNVGVFDSLVKLTPTLLAALTAITLIVVIVRKIATR